MTKALMIDIEALATAPNAYIAQVGFCVANLDTRTVTKMPVNMWVRDEDQRTRRLDPDTIRRWLRRDPKAIASVHNPVEALTVSAALLFDTFDAMVQAAKRDGDDFEVWAAPAAFDLPILKSLWGGKTPWHGRQERCLSAVGKSLDPKGLLMPPKYDMAHDAASDADWQLRYLMNLWPVIQRTQADVQAAALKELVGAA